MTIEQLNALSRAEFVKELGGIFEHSPWVAERAWEQRPFVSVEDLHAAMTAAMQAALPEEQLALLRAHPELGSRGPMSTVSKGEQASVFGSGEPPKQEAVQQYREKFGFPFIYAVKGSSVIDIAFALMIRINETPEEEFQQALREVRRIAWFRLQDRFKES
jgi:2-oxo-4-hydroxy-4-carboxy-5-ureidoimidazoline decarboxylase